MADAAISLSFTVVRSAEGAHVRMTHETAHDTDSLGCWCAPRFYLPCDECERGQGCWKCERGLIELTREQADASDVPLVIVHN